LFTLIKAQKEKEKDATAKVLQILQDSPFIGVFQVEIVYEDEEDATAKVLHILRTPPLLADSKQRLFTLIRAQKEEEEDAEQTFCRS
jgi:hypothetical protein